MVGVYSVFPKDCCTGIAASTMRMVTRTPAFWFLRKPGGLFLFLCQIVWLHFVCPR